MKIDISDEDLNKLGDLLGKDSEVYQRIFIGEQKEKKHYKKHKKYTLNVKVRKLRRLAKIARETKERELVQAPQIPEWLFKESVMVEPEKSIDLVTIDTLNMLNKYDRKKVLDNWHDWKKRQKEIDKRYAKAEERRVYKMRAMKKDPEGWAARTLKYKEREKAKNRALRATTKWRKTHRKTRGLVKMTPEEHRIRSRELERLHRKDPEWVAKHREHRRQKYLARKLDKPRVIKPYVPRPYVPRVKGIRRSVEERKVKDRIRARVRYNMEKNSPEYIAKKRAQYDARKNDPEHIMKQVEYYLLNREKILAKYRAKRDKKK